MSRTISLLSILLCTRAVAGTVFNQNMVSPLEFIKQQRAASSIYVARPNPSEDAPEEEASANLETDNPEPFN